MSLKFSNWHLYYEIILCATIMVVALGLVFKGCGSTDETKAKKSDPEISKPRLEWGDRVFWTPPHPCILKDNDTGQEYIVIYGESACAITPVIPAKAKE